MQLKLCIVDIMKVCDYCKQPPCNEIMKKSCNCMKCRKKDDCPPDCTFAGNYNNPLPSCNTTIKMEEIK
jgi:hypothetical protein